MPDTPSELVQFTWHFELSQVGNPSDLAEFSIACHRDSIEPDDGGLLSLCEGAYAAWGDHMPGDHWCDNVRLTYVQGRMFAADGKTLREQRYIPPSNPWFGTGAHPAMPWETSLALSLYTYPRGSFTANARRKRGRIYLPPMASSVLDSSNSGFYSNALIPVLLSELHEFMTHVGEDALGVSVINPGVYSRVDGVVRDVTQLSIDAKFDSQRRRENREISGHLEADL